MVGLAEEYPALADFRHEARTAINRLVQEQADAYRAIDIRGQGSVPAPGVGLTVYGDEDHSWTS